MRSRSVREGRKSRAKDQNLDGRPREPGVGAAGSDGGQSSPNVKAAESDGRPSRASGGHHAWGVTAGGTADVGAAGDVGVAPPGEATGPPGVGLPPVAGAGSSACALRLAS